MTEQPKALVDILTAHVFSGDGPFEGDESFYAETSCYAIQQLQDHYKWLRGWGAPYSDEAWLRILDSDTDQLCENIKRWAQWVHEQAGL